MARATVAVSVALALAFGGAAWAVVPDPQIMTDHPVYRGELSCSTLDRNIAEAYRIFGERYGHAPASDTEKLVALWAWKCEHYMHNCDPYVYVGPGDPDGHEDGWMETRDCQMGQFSFGFSLCYDVHAQLSALVGHALGDLKRVRCPLVPGHTSFEAFVDGRWALADITTGMMVFDDEGRPCSIQDIVPHAADAKWTSDPRRGGFGRFRMTPFGDTFDVYREFHGSQMLFGYDAMPIVYDLRAGESFTRYLDPGLEDGQTWCFWGRDYYELMGKPKHGPYRNVTFLDDPPVGNERKGVGRAYTGNGVFEYAVPLADGRYKEGVWSEANTAFADGALRASGPAGEVVFEHVSPYVICARSAKGGDREWQIRQEECVDGAIASGRAVGDVRVAVSTDAGQTWQHVGPAGGECRRDFTDVVKGRHAYWIRFGLGPESGLASLKLRTVVQVSRAVFPRLKDGGTTVTYEAGNQAVVHGGPSKYLAERFRVEDEKAPGYRVYRIRAAGPIRHAAGVERCEGPDRGPWSVEFSVDGGKTWQAGLKDLTLAEGESDWGGGRHAYAWAEMDFPQGDSKEVQIRFGKGNILHCEVYATYEVPNDSGLEVTYGWLEGGQLKQDTHSIAAGKSRDTWTVPTGEGVQNKWVRFEAK
jgi:hypothetical protein